MRAAARFVAESTLRLSKNPLAEVASTALEATEAAGLADEGADYIVVAVPRGTAGSIVDQVDALAVRAPEPTIQRVT